MLDFVTCIEIGGLDRGCSAVDISRETRKPLCGETLLMPDFWLNEACNVLWLQRVFSPDEAREGQALLRVMVEPTPTGGLE